MDERKRLHSIIQFWKVLILRTGKLLFYSVVAFTSLILSIATWIIIQFPSDNDIKGCITTKLYAVKLCPKNSNYVRISAVSGTIMKAIVHTEDSAFFTHHGFDFKEIENSFKTNLSKGKLARGGSTITQQLAKNMFLSTEKTFSRKILEALITIRLEKILTKKEILEKYLNIVQFGKDLYGVGPACQFYFHKTPSQISVVEGAFLAFLLPSPEKYSKSFFKGELTPFARDRLGNIIDQMYAYNKLNDEEYLNAKVELDGFLKGSPKSTDPGIDQIDELSLD